MKLLHLTPVFALLLIGCAREQPLREPRDAAARLPMSVMTSTVAPIPPSERTLPAIWAEHWMSITTEKAVLEGPSFERNGGLIFTNPLAGRLHRTDASRQVTQIGDFKGTIPGGTALHRAGRVFVAVAADQFRRGWILALNPDGSNPQMIVPADRGYVPNDLVFDAEGGFYFSDFQGTSTQASGGVYYVAPDYRTITPVLRPLARANGIALSPDEKILWVTEHGANRLHRVSLASRGKPATNGTSVPYHFAGPAPDSMRVDSQGHLYVALNGQGRVLVFADNGVPIAQILLPGREQRRFLETTSLALSPLDDSLFIVSGDRKGDSGAAIFKAHGLSTGLKLFSHR